MMGSWNGISFMAMSHDKDTFDHCIQTDMSGHWDAEHALLLNGFNMPGHLKG